MKALLLNLVFCRRMGKIHFRGIHKIIINLRFYDDACKISRCSEINHVTIPNFHSSLFVVKSVAEDIRLLLDDTDDNENTSFNKKKDDDIVSKYLIIII